MSMNLTIYYKGNRHGFLEEKIKSLCTQYNGIILEDFKMDAYNEFYCLAKFAGVSQESNFKKDVQHLATYLDIKVFFGGQHYL